MEGCVPLQTASSIYEVPLILEEHGLGNYIVERLGLQNMAKTPDLTEWRALVERIRTPKRTLNIALVGKYVELKDSYKSIQTTQRISRHLRPTKQKRFGRERITRN